MNNLKNFFKTIVILSLIIIIIIISLNSIFSNYIKKDLREIKISIFDIENKYQNLYLPIKILNTISSQDNEDILSKNSSVKLKQTFNKNYNLLLENTQAIDNKTNYLINLLNNLKYSKLLNINSHLKNIIGDLKKSNDNIKQMNDILINIKNYDNFKINSNTIDELVNSYENSTQVPKNLLDFYNSLSNKIIDNFFNIFSFIFIFSILIMIFIAFLLIYLLSTSFKVMLDSLSNLENHNYDIKKISHYKDFFLEQKKLKKYLINIFKEEIIINNIRNIVSKEYVIENIIEKLFYEINKIFKIQRIGVAFVDYEKQIIIAEHSFSPTIPISLGPGFTVNIEQTTLQNIIKEKKPIIFDDLEKDFEKRPNSKSLLLLKKEGIKSNITLPLILDNSVFGFLFLSSNKKNYFKKSNLKISNKIAYDLSILLEKSYLTKIIFAKMTNTFAALVEQKDNETGNHIIRMVKYSVVISKSLLNHTNPNYKVTTSFVRDIENHASSHDIGKVGIPDNILKKPGKLNDEEWTIMKTHAQKGGEIFASLNQGLDGFSKNFYKAAEDIARYHHEKWDGSGYPKGLKGQEIPLCARIVAIADVFDALSSKRVYKQAFSFDKALDMIIEQKNKHFDPILVDIFIDNIKKIKEIYDKYN
ncbi:HD domain-containing phosphohydrolase [Peptostreptococcaceae bacterium AGR-M142]